jgi:hypothetical protein
MVAPEQIAINKKMLKTCHYKNLAKTIRKHKLGGQMRMKNRTSMSNLGDQQAWDSAVQSRPSVLATG